MDATNSDQFRRPFSDLLYWTIVGIGSGAAYGAYTASMHGLIGTATSRAMLLKSIMVFTGAASTYSIARQAIGHANPQLQGTIKQAGGGGCAAGAAVGVLVGSVPAGIGACCGLALMAALSTVLDRDVKDGRLYPLVKDGLDPEKWSSKDKQEQKWQ